MEKMKAIVYAFFDLPYPFMKKKAAAGRNWNWTWECKLDKARVEAHGGTESMPSSSTGKLTAYLQKNFPAIYKKFIEANNKT